MRLHQKTKEQRREIAIRSDEILEQSPNITVKNISSRLGISANRFYSIRKEFDCCSLKDIPGREKFWKDIR